MDAALETLAEQLRVPVAAQLPISALGLIESYRMSIADRQRPIAARGAVLLVTWTDDLLELEERAAVELAYWWFRQRRERAPLDGELAYLARAIMLPRDALLHDMQCLGRDVALLQRRHRYVPRAWIAQRMLDLESRLRLVG